MKKLVPFVFFFGAVFGAARAQVIIIANPNVKANEISKADLHEVFTGSATTLKDGSRVIPILMNEGTASEEFLKAYIGKSDSAYRATWRSLVFSGQATMPKILEGDEAVVAFVLAHNGAIGYIDKGSAHAGVKVLTIK
jgi:ABC-type phosphate transport system substrate-binding protein